MSDDAMICISMNGNGRHCVGTWKGGRVLNLFFKVIDPGVTNFDFTS